MTSATTFRTPAHQVSSQAVALTNDGIRKFAYRLYLLFMVSWFLHIPERFAVLGTLRFDLLLVLLLSTLTILVQSDGVKLDKRTNGLILGLIGYVILTLPFVEWPGSVLRENLIFFVKSVVFYYFTTQLTRNERDLRLLLFVFLGCQVFRVLEPLYLHVTTGYWGGGYGTDDGDGVFRLSGAPLDVIGANGLAFVVLTVIPFAHYLLNRSKRGAVVYVALLPAVLYVLVLTASRSGMLGLMMTFAAIWLQSRRKVWLSLIVVMAFLAVAPQLTDEQRDRYQSIVSTNTRNRGTAQSRLDGVKRELGVAMRRPLFGHGLGTSFEANGNFADGQNVTHNLVAQVLQELGIIGFGIFAALLLSIARLTHHALRVLKAASNASPFLLNVGKAITVWFAMNLLFSLFTYGLSNYNWYFLAGVAQVLTALATTQASRPAASAPASTAVDVARVAGSVRTPASSPHPFAPQSPRWRPTVRTL